MTIQIIRTNRGNYNDSTKTATKSPPSMRGRHTGEGKPGRGPETLEGGLGAETRVQQRLVHGAEAVVDAGELETLPLYGGR